MKQFFKEFFELCLILWNMLNVPAKVMFMLAIVSMVLLFITKLGTVLKKKEPEKSIMWGRWFMFFKVLSLSIISIIIIYGICYSIYPHTRY